MAEKATLGKNYILLGGWLRLTYAFVDTNDYRADSLFIRHKVTVDFKEEYKKDDTEYRVIFCQIRRKDKEEFEKALDELITKIELFGHTDYVEFCQCFLANMPKE